MEVKLDHMIERVGDDSGGGKAVPVMGVGFTCCSESWRYPTREGNGGRVSIKKRLKQTVLSQICSLLQGRHGSGAGGRETLVSGH